MNRQYADAKLGGFANRGADGRGDVVIFQIKKDSASRGHELAHDLRAFGGVELHTDFVGRRGVAHGCHNLSGGGRSGHIQGDDQMLTRIVYQSTTHPGGV